MKLLRHADQFGASFQPKFNSKSEHKTLLGGILSILMYGLCISYTLYVFIKWGTDEILPKSSTNYQVLDNLELLFDYDVLEIKLISDIDPFSRTNNILMPLLVTLKDQAASGKQIMFPNEKGWIIPRGMELELNNDGSDTHKQKDIEIQFTECQPTLVVDGMSCADQSTIDAFFNSRVTIEIKIWITQYNLKTQKFNKIPKIVEFIVEQHQTVYNKYLLQTSRSFVDVGALFDNTIEYTFVSDYTLSTQTVSLDVLKYTYSRNVFAQFKFSIDPIQQVSYISYIKLDEILASIGSICSIILILSFLAISYNKRNHQEYMLERVISYYYPSIKDVSIQRNTIGRIVGVSSNGVRYDVAKFIKYYDQLRDIARQKMKMKNILYEISRLQFIVQSLQNRSTLLGSHRVGIKLKLHQSEQLETMTEMGMIGDIVDEHTLLDSDFYLLSRYKRTEPMEQTQYRFYERNYITRGKYQM